MQKRDKGGENVRIPTAVAISTFFLIERWFSGRYAPGVGLGCFLVVEEKKKKIGTEEESGGGDKKGFIILLACVGWFVGQGSARFFFTARTRCV